MKQKKQKKPEVLLGIIGLILLLIAGYAIVKQHLSENQTDEGPKKVHGGPCPGETKTFVQNDVYMRGIIEKGEEFKVIMNYYDCNPVKAGDIVLYTPSSQLDPIVKIAKAGAGDHFKLVKDKMHRAWNLLINGKMVMTEKGDTPYFFGGETPATLSLYEKTRKGVIRPNEALLLSSWPPGDSDSGTTGLVDLVDIVGKVELSEKKVSTGETPIPVASPRATATPPPRKKNRPSGAKLSAKPSPSPHPEPSPEPEPEASPAEK